VVAGYAIVSMDDRINDASGNMPEALRNEADWRRFQAELDRAQLVVLGRLGHEAHPNPRGRMRLVVSSSAQGLEQRDGVWWWNPAGRNWDSVVGALLPGGGRVAVPGGRLVFDLFWRLGFDEFHLTRATRAHLGAGQFVFSACAGGVSAESLLAAAGLAPSSAELIDAAAGVTSTLWSRAAGN
jgi:hypothetical protein